jgi:zinc transport system permease protein
LAGRFALMPWPFDVGFMQRALAAGLIVGLVAPLIGAFIVQRRMSLLGDGIGHLAFAGVAIGLAAGTAPLPTALLISVTGALIIEWLRRRGVSGDLVLALLFYVGIAAGVVVVSAAGSLDASVLSYLFGQLLTVTNADLLQIAGLGLGVLLVLAIAGRAIFAVVVDETSARVAGLPVALLGSILTVLVAVTVVLSMRVVGVLLVAAMMVLPVGAAGFLTRSFRSLLIAASSIGAFGVVSGLVFARRWPVAPGGAIVLCVAVIFVIAAIGGHGRWRLAKPATLAGPDTHHPHPHSH